MKLIIPEQKEILNFKNTGGNLETAVQQFRQLLKKATFNKKLQEPIGVLFSGGVDSTLISTVLKDLNIKYTGYFGYVKNKKTPKDLFSAREAADFLSINLKEGFVYEDELEEILPQIIKIIKTKDPVQVAVAIPLFVALREAKDDGIKTMFCGSGADEIFCGYNMFNLINKDYYLKSLMLLKKLEKEDFLRDNRLANHFDIFLVSPFLEKNTIYFGLSLNDEHKKTKKQNKIVIRELLKDYGFPKEIYERKKKAAQYGSNSDSSLSRLSRSLGFKKKQDYFSYMENNTKKRYACLFSGGKDSNLSLFFAKKNNIDIRCLLSVLPKSDFSYMFQKPDRKLLDLQAESLDIPIIFKSSKSEKEKELKDLEFLIKKAINNYRIEGVVTGALFSNYQKKRIEDICKKNNISCYSPLWQMPQDKEMELLLENNFKFIFTKVAAQGLSEDWLGKEITNKELSKLKKIHKKNKINVAGEGGEFESFVIDSPLFQKKIKIIEKKIKKINDNCSLLFIKNAKLVDK
jgi:diphthine-ammonia ligase